MSLRALMLLAPPLKTCSFITTNPSPNYRHPSFSISRCSSFSSSSLRESQRSLDLPLLPFQSDESCWRRRLQIDCEISLMDGHEGNCDTCYKSVVIFCRRVIENGILSRVLVPSESKTLHLYEARFLALLEESLLTDGKIFVHFVLDPVVTDRSTTGESFAARYGCLVLIEKTERLEIGALVSIRGIGRVSIVDIVQMEPYLRGAVVPLQDKRSDSGSGIQPKVEELKKSLHSLQSLQVKLKAPKNELLQTRTRSSLLWAEEVYEDVDQSFIPKYAERLSFAALQPVSGFSQSELLSLQRDKLRAMDTQDTVERLDIGIKFAKQNIAMVAAKLAIQSLGM